MCGGGEHEEEEKEEVQVDKEEGNGERQVMVDNWVFRKVYGEMTVGRVRKGRILTLGDNLRGGQV